ncbi:MAG: LD-carboxypeptidase [Chitinophagaceae bacterium]|nr:MAG: LD-carboxypeptidase [Chitinophagaceae bacterium]
MMKIPSYLMPGDTIGIVCPAGYMAREKAEICIQTLAQWGYRVKTGATLGGASGTYFSGSDDERLADLQAMLDDESVKAILCGRGGYGTSRIIDQLNFRQFKKNPKWIIGFSDITVLHSHISRNFKIATLHAPMAGAFNGDGYANQYVLSLKEALEGKKANYSIPSHSLNINGSVSGKLTGGNLTLIAHLLGTNSEIKTKGRILFLEDIGEQLYNIDRMFVQLKRNRKLDELAGLIVGGFSDTKDTERPFGNSLHQLILHHVKEFGYPVCFDFPVSHEKENYALKVGGNFQLDVGDDVVLREVDV